MMSLKAVISWFTGESVSSDSDGESDLMDGPIPGSARSGGEAIAVPIIRWGIAGSGRRAEDFAMALKASNGCRLMAVGSNQKDDAIRLGEKFGADRCYGSFVDLAADDDLDVVYVSTAASYNRDICLLLLEQKRNVVCGMPASVNEADVEDMVDFAQQKHLLFIEAMSMKFSPAMQKVQELISQDIIGTVSLVRAECGVKAQWDSNLREIGEHHGAILPSGAYAVALSSLAFSEAEPASISAAGMLIPGGGADSQVAMVISYGLGRVANIVTSTMHDLPCEANIYGTKGTITLPYPFWQPEKVIVRTTEGVKGSVIGTQTFEFPFPEGPREDEEWRADDSAAAMSMPSIDDGSCEAASMTKLLVVKGSTNDEVAVMEECQLPVSKAIGDEAEVRYTARGGTEEGDAAKDMEVVLDGSMVVQDGCTERAPKNDDEEKSQAVPAGRAAEEEEDVYRKRDSDLRRCERGGFVYVIEEVHRCLREGLLESSMRTHYQTRRTLRTLDRARFQFGLKFAAESVHRRIPSLSEWGQAPLTDQPLLPGDGLPQLPVAQP